MSTKRKGKRASATGPDATTKRDEVTASFAGNANYAPASGTTALTITQAAATVSVTGGSFTYSGAQRPASGFAYGVGGVTDVVSPAVTYTYAGTGGTTYGPSPEAPAAAGTYLVTASFAGNANYTGASGSASITINQASTSTTLAASSNPSLLAKAVTLTAKVTAIAPGAGLPTGPVTFKDGATTLGTVALANVGGIATATFTTAEARKLPQ